MVCELDGPMPILKSSKRLWFTAWPLVPDTSILVCIAYDPATSS